MDCLTANRQLSGYLEGLAPERRRREMQAHLRSCSSCSERVDELVRASVKRLPVLKPSAVLTSKLMVAASQASQKRRYHLARTALERWYDVVRMSTEHLLRPLMVPVAGGLAAAMLLFGLLVPDLAHELHPVSGDIDTLVYTPASIKDLTPIGVEDTDIMLDVTVDENGRMLEYKVVAGESLLKDEHLKRRLVDVLMYGQFNPATQFGQRVAGRLRIGFRSSSMDVRG